VLECLVRHHRTEVRAADPDVDDVANALAGVPLPRAAPHAVREIGHGVVNGVDRGHHVLTVDDDRRAARRPQGHVQDGTVFGHVDLVSLEHRVDALAEPALFGQPTQQPDGLVRNAILGVIEVDSHGLRGQAFATRCVGGEERAEVLLPDVVPVHLERLPRLARGQWQHSCHRSSLHVFGAVTQSICTCSSHGS